MSLIRASEYLRGCMEGRLVVNVFVRGKLEDEFVLVEEWRGKNILVDNMKTMMAHLVAGDVTNRSIAKIGFGSSGSAAAPSNTSLTNLYSRAVGAITYPTSSSVQFAWSLGTSEANGLAIMEFGLLSANNGLFSRRVRSTPINKTSDMSLSGTWGISF